MRDEDDRELKVDEVTAALEAAFDKSACGMQRAANRQPPAMWICTCGFKAPTAKALLDHHNDKHERI
jgi:hypothetical protein